VWNYNEGKRQRREDQRHFGNNNMVPEWGWELGWKFQGCRSVVVVVVVVVMAVAVWELGTQQKTGCGGVW
jgi:hypothetical protein